MVVVLATAAITAVAPRSGGLVCELMFCLLPGSGLPRIPEWSGLNSLFNLFIVFTDFITRLNSIITQHIP